MSRDTKSARVWVADDSPLDAERARRGLASLYDVEVFHDGTTVLERLSSEPAPDVLVLDWVMPEITGIEVCRFLRAQGAATNNLGILLLTAHRDTQQIVEGLSAGANDYLAKPYAEEELSARVAALVRSRELLRRAELAERALRRVLETSPDPLLVFDAQNRTSFVNEQASAVLGDSKESLRQRPLSDLVPEFPAGVLSSVAPDSAVSVPDFSVGGKHFSASVRVLPPNDVASSIVSLRDVTEKRRLDERRLDFYSIIAHDLRSPLNVLKLRLIRMLGLPEQDRPPRLVSELERMDRTLDGLIEMINDFLSLASLEGVTSRLKRDVVDLSGLMQSTVNEFRPLLEARGQCFVDCCAHDGKATRVLGDAQRLSQVLSNLISNAIKFTPPDGTITGTIELHGQNVRVTIADDGCGIAADVLPKLFQRYQRVEHRVAGTGLGLLIVREIVEAHQGTVGVESEPGKGSRFWFELPQAFN